MQAEGGSACGPHAGGAEDHDKSADVAGSGQLEGDTDTRLGRDADPTCSSYDTLAGEELDAARLQIGQAETKEDDAPASLPAVMQAGGPLLLLIPLTLGMGKVRNGDVDCCRKGCRQTTDLAAVLRQQ